LDFRQKRPDFEIFPVIFPVSREFAPADGFAGTACTTKIFSNINRLHGMGARAAARRPVLATNSYTAKAIATNVAQSLAMSVMAAHSLFNIVLCEFGQAPIPLKINPPPILVGIRLYRLTKGNRLTTSATLPIFCEISTSARSKNQSTKA
jgi:hypothetical protein